MNYHTAPNTIQRAAVEGMCRSMGLPYSSVNYAPPAGRSALPQNFTLRDVAHICVEGATPGERSCWSDRHDLIARALTTSDFAIILADIGNKQLLASYAARPASFTRWASQGYLPNFKKAHVCRVTAPGMLPELREDEEYKMLKLSDGEEVVWLRTFGGILPLSRHSIINDDLDALRDRSNLLAQAASLTQSKLATEALIRNSTMSDGVEVFHADRGNLLTGTDSALSADSLAKAVAAMRRFKNDNGQPLLIEPKFLVVGPDNERIAHQLSFSDSDPASPNNGVPNFFKTIGLQPIVDPLLESASITGGSAKAWYLLPDPAVVPVIRYYTLGGSDLAPYIESHNGFNTDNLEMKTRIDFAAAPIGSFAVKSTGE